MATKNPDGNINLTGYQFQEILKTHGESNASNVVTWRDTWKIMGILTALLSVCSGLVLGLLGANIRNETENLIYKNNEKLRLEYAQCDQRKDAQIKANNSDPN